MVATVLKLVGFDLQRQLARLKAQAEDFKDRTTDEIKHKAVNVGLAIGLAFAGLVFVVLTIVAGLIALYLWVEMKRGPFVGLGAVALTTMLLAACLFILAATRGNKEKKREKPRARVTQDAGLAVSPAAERLASAVPPHGSFVDAITQDLTDRTAAAANEALDTAAGIVRKSPREAILAALAIAVVAGVVLGRRRGR